MKLPFDKVYFLTLTDDEIRVNNVKEQINKLNIEDITTIWYTCKTPYSRQCGEVLLKDHWFCKGNEHRCAGIFNCAMNHYQIIKTSYQLGLNSILVCEDDCVFIDNIDLIEESFNNLPENYCCVKYYNESQKYFNLYIESDKQEYSKEDYGGKYMNTVCYCMDREGMKKYIDSFDREFRPADEIFSDFINDVWYNKVKIVELLGINSNIV